MTQDAGHDHLGDPLAGPVREGKAFVRREGDSGLGVPEFEALHARTLSTEETEAHGRARDDEAAREAEEILADLEEDEGWLLPRSLRNLAMGILVVVEALLGLFVTTQAVRFLADLAALPRAYLYPAVAFALLFGSVLVVAFVALLRTLFRLHRAPRIRLQALRALAERRDLRQVARHREEEARRKLRAYLKTFPLEGRGRRRLLAAGLPESVLSRLEEQRRRLLDESRPLKAADWIDDFMRGFQKLLDEAAEARVKSHARRVAVGTAASPVGIVDQAVVLFGCTAMAKDLFVLYNLRPAAGQTALVLGRSIVHTYLSGLAGEATEKAADTFLGSAEAADEGLGALTGTLGKALSARAAEASLNALLLWRLGKRIIGLLQPVR
ncbi:DUF697 domain-containing protein [Aminithiophilus ramosus]|uniref:DUF697 domain-containing protein n=1 Tax=Aminithiophilus ramosus TaxID=3029084 RepID=A0A9Q7A8J8_9BACT|nr:DUF697 domain-containing protein [Aminithiophilus ramosus]QTX32625.1 DUF697 domain-containing protein [Aminithiophilus ramosus]